MPAQWPTFISNVSNKLSGKDVSSRDEFAKFLANEYFNSVKTSQTIYGNIHQSGQKIILEEGFKLAFKKIYEEESIKFEDKFSNSKYSDLFEKTPEPNYNYDVLCEIEDWTKSNKNNLNKFKFYPLFASTCPIKKETLVSGGIDFNLLTTQPSTEEIPYITLSIFGFTEETYYKILYSINGEDQPLQTVDKTGILQILAPTFQGTFTYTFKSVWDVDGQTLLKNVDKSVTITNDGNTVNEIINIVKDISKPIRKLIPDMTEDERILAISYRILYQNDESISFAEWVNRLDTGYNAAFGKKVKSKVLELAKPAIDARDAIKKKSIKNTNNKTIQIKDISIPKIDTIQNTLNEYVFQEEYADQKNNIPDWLTPPDYICKFVYIANVDDIKGSTKLLSSGAENSRIIKKQKEYYDIEKNLWYELLRRWGNSQTESLKTTEESYDGDGYDLMAKAVIDYWKSTLVQPFKNTPPIPPCTSIPPLNGVYAPISYGMQRPLANDLRRAWNTGKSFKFQPLTPVASKAVSAALAVSFAKHILTIKFLYLGGFIIPVGPPVPMVGLSPTVF